MNALPDHLRLLGHSLPLPRQKSFFSGLFNFQVEVDWDNRVLAQILRRLEVLVGPNLGCLQALEDVDGVLLNWLGQLLQELDMIVILLIFLFALAFRLRSQKFLVFVRREVNFKL